MLWCGGNANHHNSGQFADSAHYITTPPGHHLYSRLAGLVSQSVIRYCINNVEIYKEGRSSY